MSWHAYDDSCPGCHYLPRPKLMRSLDWPDLSYHEKRYVLLHSVLPKRFRQQRETERALASFFADEIRLRGQNWIWTPKIRNRNAYTQARTEPGNTVTYLISSWQKIDDP